MGLGHFLVSSIQRWPRGSSISPQEATALRAEHWGGGSGCVGPVGPGTRCSRQCIDWDKSECGSNEVEMLRGQGAARTGGGCRGIVTGGLRLHPREPLGTGQQRPGTAPRGWAPGAQKIANTASTGQESLERPAQPQVQGAKGPPAPPPPCGDVHHPKPPSLPELTLPLFPHSSYASPKHGHSSNRQDEQPEPAQRVGPSFPVAVILGKDPGECVLNTEFRATAVSLAVPTRILGVTDGQRQVRTLGQGGQSWAAGGGALGTFLLSHPSLPWK